MILKEAEIKETDSCIRPQIFGVKALLLLLLLLLL